MKKSIKITDEVYQSLLSMQRPRETFSAILQRLIQLETLLRKAEPIIRGHQAYERWQKEQEELAKIPH